jgi:acid phosphatase family membrane protein YuiD
MFWTAAFGWIVAQTIKVTIGVITEKRFNFRWFVGTGGLPSAHAAGVSSLATAVGITYGVSSAIFAITLTFTIIVLFDAQTVRRSTGVQAKILNKMLDDIYWRKKLDEKRLIELIGHTPFQVFAGMIVGVLVALISYYGHTGKDVICGKIF